MHEVQCPHCGQTFSVDGAGYAAIVKQVRDAEFQQDLHERLELEAKNRQAAIELAEAKVLAEAQKAASEKDAEIERLKAQVDADEVARQLAVKEALSAVEKERDALSAQLEQTKLEQQAKLELAEAKRAAEHQQASAAKDAEIEALKSKLNAAETEKELEVTKAVSAVEKTRDDLERDLKAIQTEQQLRETALKQNFETQLKDRDDTIERLKDMKAKLSTKMLGETLEQHCEIEFERLRSTAFQTATFGKDNDASSGSKGDFIFRDHGVDGVEYISIMFEMKNEADTTVTKKRNEDFFKELDKDRNEKGCEYAVLVSMLEPDSELYNGGILDVSHHYPKMYVVRPQFFIPIITLLRNAAQATIQVKSELTRVQEQNIDITNFETSLQKFKQEFSYSFGHASTQFDEAIHRIDEAIKDLEKTKESLRKSLGHLSAANNKAEKVSIKALTRGNPTMAAKFAELERDEVPQ